MVRTIPEPGDTGARPGLRLSAAARWFSGPKWQARLIIVLSVVLLFSTALALSLTRKEVRLTVDGRTHRVVTHRRLVRTFLAEQRVHLGPADEVQPSLSSRLTGGAQVTVYRAVPVTVRLDGGERSLLTAKQTVGEALAAAGIRLGEHDRTVPALSGPVTANAEIVVRRVKVEDVVQRLEIPFATLRRLDAELEKGRERVVKPGVKGIKERVVRVTTEDGKVVAKAVVSEKVIKEAQPRLVAVGTKRVVRTLRTSRGEYRYIERRIMEATAYDPGPGSNGPKWTGRTYLGLKAQYGIVAVDPRVIPLRTRLYIPGYGEALAADTGGAVKGNRIDLCFNTYEEAISFGRRRIEVYILE